MTTQVANIMTRIFAGIVIAVCIGFTITGDLPWWLALSVVIAVTITAICGVYQHASSDDLRD